MSRSYQQKKIPLNHYQSYQSFRKQSVQTDDSDRSDDYNSTTYTVKSNKLYRGPHRKEKLELCKKFSQNGYCPYHSKCKFAHGSHELRKNNTTNIRYKTKECGTFFQHGHCHYGDRCNFLHKRIAMQGPSGQSVAISSTNGDHFEAKLQKIQNFGLKLLYQQSQSQEKASTFSSFENENWRYSGSRLFEILQ